MIYNKPRDISFRLYPSFITTKKKAPKKATQWAERKKHLTKIVLFLMALYTGTVISFIIPLRPDYSVSEKRELKKFPEFTVKALYSGTYFDDISFWFSDTFPFREELSRINTALTELYGFETIAIHGDVEKGDEIPDTPAPPVTHTEIQTTEPVTSPETTMPQTTAPATQTPENTEKKPDINIQSMGAILVAGDSAYEYYNFSGALAERFINSVNNIKSVSGNKSNVYSLIIPTSIDITLNDAIRADINTSDQKSALDYFISSTRNATAVPGIYETQRLHRNEYTYFRTDHHWTSLGAYYAYTDFANAKGIIPVGIEQYETVSYKGFLGTFYSSSGQSKELAKKPDTVTACLPINNTTCTLTDSNGYSSQIDVITDVTDYAQNMKYLTFIGGDQALITIENNDLTEGETCIVIKESYGNAFVPFLIPHYKTIYVIDPRHYKSTLSEFVSDKEIHDIIFLANISTTRNSIYIDAMEGFIK